MMAKKTLKSRLKPGDRIPITIDGETFQTIIDDQGVQRFESNPIIRWLVDNNMGVINQIVAAYQNGHFSQKALLCFYADLGYSVDGLSTMTFFQDLEWKNPLWKKK